jgi:predicted glutamine amidotransferase
MCRLYGFRATEPTTVECTLVSAQNALIVQSQRDQEGRSNAHGWGVAVYPNGGLPHVERQAWAAYHCEHFREAAARAHARAVVAHVRRATMGVPALENTHPFSYRRWAFAHNGTLRAFGKIRGRMRAAITPEHRAALQGTTDSEHIFYFLLSLREREPDRPPLDTLRAGLQQLILWSRGADPEAPIGLNVLWTDGECMVGSRWRRTLFYLERDEVRDCEVCGCPHVEAVPETPYRAAVVASERISHEPWREVPEGSSFAVDEAVRLHFEPLEQQPTSADDRAAEEP